MFHFVLNVMCFSLCLWLYVFNFVLRVACLTLC